MCDILERRQIDFSITEKILCLTSNLEINQILELTPCRLIGLLFIISCFDSKSNVFTSFLHTNFVTKWMISEQLLFSTIVGPSVIPSVWQMNSIRVVHCLFIVSQTEPDPYTRTGESDCSSRKWSWLLARPIEEDWPPVTRHAPALSLHGFFGSEQIPNT